MAGGAGRRRAGRAAGLLASWCRDRRHRRPRSRAAVPDRVHPRARPRDGVLAVAADPQAGPSGRAAAHGARGGRRRARDRGRLPRALPVRVRRAAGPHRAARPDVRGLRRRPLRAGRRLGGAQVAAGPGLEPDRWQAAIRRRRAVHPASRGGGGRGPVLAGVHPRAGPPRRGRRRPGRAAGPLAERADRVLREPQAGRGVDLPVPRRRVRVGRGGASRADPYRSGRRRGDRRRRDARRRRSGALDSRGP